MLLVVDHRDSFTWNLVHALGRTGTAVRVVEHEALTPGCVRALRPSGLVLSPGPGHPREASASLALVEALAGELPILGVCLGHQVICSAFGARIGLAPQPFHGRTSRVHHDGSALFAGLPSPLLAARYHSLVVEPDSLPAALIGAAWTDSGELMSVRHARLPLWSLQFHPESFLTEHGQAIVQNFIEQLAAPTRTFVAAAGVSAQEPA